MKANTKLSANALATGACLAVVVTLTVAIVGCGGDGGTIASSIGGSLGIGGGRSSSGGGLFSGFVPGDTGRYLDAGHKALQAEAIGDREEIAYGQGVALSLTNGSNRLVEDAALNEYVTKVGLAVAMVSYRTDYTYVFGVLDSDQVAAYSGPRGYVLITRGAIATMQDEAELAGVLAHEVAHVAQQHGIKAVKGKLKTSAAVSAGATALGADEVPFGSFMEALVEEVATKGHSQGQETQADKDAVAYLIAAGYDPNAYARFLKRMGTLGASRGGLFSTHPGINRRVGVVEKQIKELNGAGGQANPERFAAATAGLKKAVAIAN